MSSDYFVCISIIIPPTQVGFFSKGFLLTALLYIYVLSGSSLYIMSDGKLININITHDYLRGLETCEMRSGDRDRHPADSII